MRESVIRIMIIMMVMLCLSECCLESEKLGLLDIKDKIPLNSEYGREYFSSWGSDFDCCRWTRVECNSSLEFGVITSLDLFGIREEELDEWYLNVSLFLPFPHLYKLGLGSNKIGGCIQNEGFERPSSTLANLEILDLSYINLNNSILQSLGAFPSLKSLELGGNRLNGTGFERLSSTLANLEILDLSYINLNNSTNILQSLGAFPSLKTLRLSSSGLGGKFNISDLDGFPNLQELDLSENAITEFIVSKDSRGPSNLSTLYLDGMTTITDEGISNLNLQSLENFPNLKTLSLRWTNFLRGIFPEELRYDYKSKMEEILLDGSSIDDNFLRKLSRAFPSLKRLSMTNLNSINGSLAIGEGSIFESLENLYLDASALDNNWLQRIGTMRSLKTLSVPGCRLSGNIPASQGLCLLKHLQELDMSFNNLIGNLPLCLGNLTSLKRIDVSLNQFSGKISSHFQSLFSLQYLDLSDNVLQIPISLTPFFNLSQLTYLDVQNNKMYADTHYDNLKPKFQLDRFCLIVHGDGTEIPKFLYHQHNLQYVNISGFKMRGMFPYWLLENNTRLQHIHLSNNSLSGPLLLPNKPHENLTSLLISDNYFNGYIPSQLGLYLPRLTSLHMSRNEFQGSIPGSMCNISSLSLLDISQNNISGSIPKCIGNMFQLTVLDLSNNSISGCLPSNFSSIIEVVKLSKNRLQGSLDNAFYNCSYLKVLDLSHNNFSGSIPLGIGRLYRLNYLVLGHNNFQGKIPIELCKLKILNFLDVSHNKISSHMISCLNFKGYSNFGRSVTLEFTVKGNTYPYKLTFSSYMSGIDISCNNLRGQIPPQIGDLGNIKALNFSHNSFTGRIPPTFSNLKGIESLDLSYNNLQGSIPHQLTRLTSIEVFNVSYNNLSGPAPSRVAQFATFDENSYKGNPFLCGWQLSKSCNEIDSTQSSLSNEESNNSLIDMEAFYWSFGVAYGMVLISIVAILCINPHWRRVWFYYVQISIDNSYYFLIDNVPFLSSFKFPKFCRRIYRCLRD
ncbi:receptor like protein 1 [Euphorbia peplus]|nr:receptor like protein 1 [Euphorbia peplus]